MNNINENHQQQLERLRDRIRSMICDGYTVSEVVSLVMQQLNREDVRAFVQQTFSLSLSDAKAVTAWVRGRTDELSAERLNELVLPAIVQSHKNWLDQSIPCWVYGVIKYYKETSIVDCPGEFPASAWNKLTDHEQSEIRRLYNLGTQMVFRSKCLSAQYHTRLRTMEILHK